MKNTYTLSEQLAATLRRFIGSCPHDQVAQLVAAFDAEMQPQARAQQQAHDAAADARDMPSGAPAPSIEP